MNVGISEYFSSIISHYVKYWDNSPNICSWEKGSISKLPINFKVLEFKPNKSRNMWTYATCCMSSLLDENPVEIHLFSTKQDKGLIELLTTVAYYYSNTQHLDLNHTVNFGQSWQDSSKCEYGLISLPFLDGPDLENLQLKILNKTLKCYWIIPITKDEVAYKQKFGINALEKQFEEKNFNYIDPGRDSVI